MKAKPTTKASLLAKLKVLEPVDADARNAIVCALIGHSAIVTYCFGYINCARCSAQLGDTLGGSYRLVDNVIVNHDCKKCRANFEKLGWKDKLYVASPFKKEAARA